MNAIPAMTWAYECIQDAQPRHYVNNARGTDTRPSVCMRWAIPAWVCEKIYKINKFIGKANTGKN